MTKQSPNKIVLDAIISKINLQCDFSHKVVLYLARDDHKISPYDSLPYRLFADNVFVCRIVYETDQQTIHIIDSSICTPLPKSITSYHLSDPNSIPALIKKLEHLVHVPF